MAVVPAESAAVVDYAAAEADRRRDELIAYNQFNRHATKIKELMESGTIQVYRETEDGNRTVSWKSQVHPRQGLAPAQTCSDIILVKDLTLRDLRYC